MASTVHLHLALALALHVLAAPVNISLAYEPNANVSLFIFGDSLVDSGNNDYLFTLSKADSPPYGIDFSASGGRPTGRFTNGRTISDIIGELLGAESFSPPYLAPSTRGKAILGGVNYASGSAGILNDTGSIFIGRIPLEAQISYFQNTKEELLEMLGKSNAEEFLRKALFSITVGANDFLNNLFMRPINSISPQSFQQTMISHFRLQLERLYELGARKLIVGAVGPIGCIPYDRAINLVPQGSCVISSNELASSFNTQLRQLIAQLNRLLPEAVFLYANSYDIVLDIIQNPRQYGFENADSPCCGDVIPPVPCSVRSNMCEDRSKYVFWDAYHPTDAVNLLIASRFLDGPLPYVSPINVRQLFYL